MAYITEPQTREDEVYEFAGFLRDHYDTIEKYLKRWAEDLRERERKLEERERAV
jgi:hypothetical protein